VGMRIGITATVGDPRAAVYTEGSRTEGK